MSTLSEPGFGKKMKIVDALDQLVAEQGYGYVSVSELCKKAETSRSTFYSYFEDKHDVLHWHSSLVYSVGLDLIGRSYTWFQGHYITTALLSRHKNLYYQAGLVPEYSNLRSFFVRKRIDTLRETLEQWHDIEIDPLLDFQIRFVAEAEGAMGERQLHGEISDEMYARFFSQSVPDPIFSILNNPTKPYKGEMGLDTIIGLSGMLS